jgi:hypothetical protein
MEEWGLFFLDHWNRIAPEVGLSDGAVLLLHYQVAVQPGEERSNFKMRVEMTGRVFLARHSGAPTGLPVDAPFPEYPSLHVESARIGQLQQALRDDQFAKLPSVIGDPNVEDGCYDAIFAQTDRTQHFVISRYAPLRTLELLAAIRREIGPRPG